MTRRSQYDEALYRLDASDWQRQEGGGDPMQEAAVAQTYATLAVADELRRANDQRDVFNAAMLDFFDRLADPFEAPPEGPSGAGATAQVGEKQRGGSTAHDETRQSHVRQRSPYVNDDESGFDV